MDNFSFLSIGSNSGDRINNIQRLFEELKNSNVIILSNSSIYKSEPLDSLSDKNFYNLVIKIKTTLDLLNFFSLTESIEVKMGRKIKNNPDMPRIIDIDILTFNNKVYKSDFLVIPHPKLYERRFVLLPWSEIA